jgi:hypothetical protein
MKSSLAPIQEVVDKIAEAMRENKELRPEMYGQFFETPELALEVLPFFDTLSESEVQNEEASTYSSCIFLMDICASQLQARVEINNKTAVTTLARWMSQMAALIRNKKHSLSFWLPLLNVFYNMHIELSDDLKEAYLDLAHEPDLDAAVPSIENVNHIDRIRALITELSDLSVFGIAEHFFSQSYAMPDDFFVDLIADLCQIEQGHEIAILTLLHPKAEIRTLSIASLDSLMDSIVLNSESLSRLQAIRHWYPDSYHTTFDRWIKTQRKKGVVFALESAHPKLHIQATEVDGAGAQGIFIQMQQPRRHQLGSLLLKAQLGIKDAWVMPAVTSRAQVKNYCKQSFPDEVSFRDVDETYLKLIVEHFLAILLARSEVPPLCFLQIQELIGIRFKAQLIDINELLTTLAVEIIPFTPERLSEAFRRSSSWLRNKSFSRSWFLESPHIDKIVNHYSSFEDGVKVCRLEEASIVVFAEVLEKQRQYWLFHFLWIALWAKSCVRKNEKTWEDSFLIAYSIHEGKPLHEIPLMQAICQESIIYSVETMRDRKTYLSQE